MKLSNQDQIEKYNDQQINIRIEKVNSVLDTIIKKERSLFELFLFYRFRIFVYISLCSSAMLSMLSGLNNDFASCVGWASAFCTFAMVLIGESL